MRRAPRLRAWARPFAGRGAPGRVRPEAQGLGLLQGPQVVRSVGAGARARGRRPGHHGGRPAATILERKQRGWFAVELTATRTTRAAPSERKSMRRPMFAPGQDSFRFRARVRGRQGRPLLPRPARSRRSSRRSRAKKPAASPSAALAAARGAPRLPASDDEAAQEPPPNIGEGPPGPTGARSSRTRARRTVTVHQGRARRRRLGESDFNEGAAARRSRQSPQRRHFCRLPSAMERGVR